MNSYIYLLARRKNCGSTGTPHWPTSAAADWVKFRRSARGTRS